MLRSSPSSERQHPGSQRRLRTLARQLLRSSTAATPATGGAVGGLHPPPAAAAPLEAPLRPMTAEEIETYLRDGAVCIRGAVSNEVVQQMRDAVDASAGTEPPTNGQAGGLNQWMTNDAFRDVMLRNPVAHYAQQIFQRMRGGSGGASAAPPPPIRFFYDQMFVKWPFASKETRDHSVRVFYQGDRAIPSQGENTQVGNNTPWHQDITFWPVEGQEIVSMWFGLDPTDVSNGGLEFIKGSHAWATRYKAYGVGVDFPSDVLEELPKLRSATNGHDPATGAYDERIVSFKTEPGDVIIFSTVVLHGAPGNFSSDRKRRALALRYIGEDVFFNDLKHGPGTLMAPFGMWDADIRNGDRLVGPAYPQLLPQKIPAEVDRRMQGKILPDPGRLKEWTARKEAIIEKQTREKGNA